MLLRDTILSHTRKGIEGKGQSVELVKTCSGEDKGMQLLAKARKQTRIQQTPPSKGQSKLIGKVKQDKK